MSSPTLAGMNGYSFGPDAGGPSGEYSRLAELVVTDPEAAWSRLLEITAEVDDAGLYWVADILEAFVIHHPARFAPLIENELETNAKLRRAFVYFVPPAADDVLADHLLELRGRIAKELRVV